MRIVITEQQLKRITELVTNKEVICDKCGWSWELSDGGKDPYMCHKCGHDNSENLEEK
jgi:tRNA(Ile2) C34 agmatinyltransferase TiaS